MTATTSPACPHLRKTNPEQILRGRTDGIFVAPFEQGEIGPALFDAACRMKLEGIVSKHRKRPYRVGRCEHWQKVKNRKHPAFTRVADQLRAMVKIPTYTGTDSETPESGPRSNTTATATSAAR